MKSALRKLERQLWDELNRERPVAPESCRVTIPQIIARLNAADNSSLIVIQAADPDALRQFACDLGMAIYSERRRSGQISPLVSFVFDEADEFIPLNFDRDSSYSKSTAIAMALARRGRKFGLGIGIATQRVTYLNTSIMAQPHTYFISKLPRQTDRQRVCEAFGISEEMFRQTFKFRKGNWLLVSHDATGLESVPLPIKTENADDRVLSWLSQLKVE
jgi:DNA helicase HerA-like ATPase